MVRETEETGHIEWSRNARASGHGTSGRKRNDHVGPSVTVYQERHPGLLQACAQDDREPSAVSGGGDGSLSYDLMNGGVLASLADLMGHESVETTKVFYVVFEQDDLRRKHDRFSSSRWGS